MAGAGIKIDVEYDDDQVMAALNRLIQAGTNLQPVFADIGEYLLQAHDERWARQEDPAGNPWAPLSPKYAARKKKNADQILVLDGFLRDLLAYNATASGLEFGTNRLYGATHQFGREEAGIPARPFLGLSADDEAEILDILQDHLTAAYSP
jgi:phage virion morphogenesis protein